MLGLSVCTVSSLVALLLRRISPLGLRCHSVRKLGWQSDNYVECRHGTREVAPVVAYLALVYARVSFLRPMARLTAPRAYSIYCLVRLGYLERIIAR